MAMHSAASLTVICTVNADVLSINNIREELDETWNYRARWRFIGIELGIDTGTLDAIAEDNRKVEDCLREMIKVWLKRASPKPTRRAMKAALQSVRVVSAAGNNITLMNIAF